MFGVSITELVLIALVVLVVFGPEKLPDLLYNIGKVMGFLQKEYMSIRREFYNSVYTPADDVRQRIDQAAKNLVTMPQQVEAPKAKAQSEENEGGSGEHSS